MSADSNIEQILSEREVTNGDFFFHSLTSQQLKSIMAEGQNWGELSLLQREALEMIQHKIARILSGNPDIRDHWDDIAGYAQLVAKDCINNGGKNEVI